MIALRFAPPQELPSPGRHAPPRRIFACLPHRERIRLRLQIIAEPELQRIRSTRPHRYQLPLQRAIPRAPTTPLRLLHREREPFAGMITMEILWRQEEHL